jgi:Spy/CpxP family protein refolding chaperone
MKTKVLLIAVLLGVTTAVFAQPKEKDLNRSACGQKNELRADEQKGPEKGLGLTDEQKESFKQSRIALEKKLRPLRNELNEAEAHQKTLLDTDKPDLAAIDKNIEKIGGIKVEIEKLRTKNRLDMLAQLTDEQRLKFAAFREHFGHEKGKRGEPGEGRPEGGPESENGPEGGHGPEGE